jgi:hypothetical protein
MSEEKGIKEILEIFDGIDVLANFGGQVMANGKVGAEDITALVGLATSFNVLQEGLKGSKEALEEGKNLDQAEVLQIIGRVYNVVESFAKAKK